MTDLAFMKRVIYKIIILNEKDNMNMDNQLLNDDYDFYTKDRVYRIHFKRDEKVYNTSKYGKYSCHMMISNNMNTLLLDINMSESEFMFLLDTLANIEEDCGSIYSDRVVIHPNSDNKQYIFNISAGFIPNHPMDDDEEEMLFDELLINLCIYERDMFTNQMVLRLIIPNIDIYYLEDLVYKGFLIIADLPNVVTNLATSYLSEYFYDENEYQKGEF